ncbi:MAG: hypothetical protein P1S60_04040, partial [Anaerolineae bacterium]|nr:hypothetical protein [Anaerolineae bacterium]
MEFMNVGGGELLIIILLALVLFSPEDILKLMRTIGNYARTARQMWSNVSKSLQEDYIPDEVKEVVKETASTVKNARSTLSEVRKDLTSMSTKVEEDIHEASEIAGQEVEEAVNTINPKPLAKSSDITNIETTEINTILPNTNDVETPEVEQTEILNSMNEYDEVFFHEKTQNIKDSDEASAITKPAHPTPIHQDNGSNGLSAKLAKKVED